jgi:hypothetical protein
MRPVGCPDEGTLGEILELPPDDPRRRHVDACPRCRSLVLAHGSFLDPPEDVEAGQAAEQVSARLDAFRADLIGGASHPAGTRTRISRPSVGARAGRARPRAWWQRIFSPALRPAWALAAVAVISAIAFVGVRQGRQPGETLVRGAVDRAMGLGAPQMLEGGAVRLSWRPAAEPVDGYELVLLSAQLETIARFEAGRDTTLTLPAAALPEAFRSGELLLYRVDARVGRDVVAQSETGSLQKPGS